MNILIVEDDTMLRSWLSMLLSSLSDYRLQIHEAQDGVDALELCRKIPVELVITDIKMPRMDGLELIQHLKKDFPEIRAAVLSSYDDFSFVKVALQYGALDYILKAEMTVKDLSQLLDKVQNDFQIEHTLAKGIFPDYRSILNAQKAIADFLSAEKSESQLREALSLPAGAPGAAILFLHLQDQLDVDIPIFEAADICEKTLFSESLHGAAVPYRGENCVLLYGCTDSVPEFQQMEAIKLISLLKNNLQKYLNLPVTFSFHRLCRHDADLRALLNEVYKSAACQQYYGDAAKCADALPDFPVWKTRIGRSLETNRFQQAASHLRACMSEAHQLHVVPEILRANLLVLLNLFLGVRVHAKERGPAAEQENLHTLLTDVAHAETQGAMETCVSHFLTAFLLLLNQAKLELSPAIRKALEYVDQHYAEKISLDSIASHVFINRSYFCQLFKKEVGLTFGDYLEHVRIENAKRLLTSTSLTILMVAEQSGFSNQAYFTKVFKKCTDMNPLRYRRIYSQR